MVSKEQFGELAPQQESVGQENIDDQCTPNDDNENQIETNYDYPIQQRESPSAQHEQGYQLTSDPVASGDIESDIFSKDNSLMNLQEVDTVLTLYAHFEQYLRSNHPELTEDEIMFNLRAGMRSTAFRNYLKSKDDMDELTKRTRLSDDVKSWYE